MMEAAGLGVAWNAKPRVQMEAGALVNGQLIYEGVEAVAAITQLPDAKTAKAA